ncbi:DUF1015 domain-containing protein [Anaerostipes faecalis]|uniref:DUF1015 domain-containing protein n=1 Tax=Anaerostipes faecalis TaxID=2738446 RepID=UPI001C1DCF4B|nr:DUF1015 domain-containing protein [Anaerostipes faecalis]
MSAFSAADILVPQVDSMEKWAVIACDQFSSQPEYWEDVRRIVGKEPSALNLILPEVELGTEQEAEHIEKIQKSMNKYRQDKLFKAYHHAFIYVERTLQNGLIRKGIVGVVDLEAYSYTVGEDAKIRATEKTVMERIPPRMKIRYNAEVELPHVILLCDDQRHTLIEPISKTKKQLPKLYDFDLMKNGGHIAGWLVQGEAAESLEQRLDVYEKTTASRYKEFGEKPMIFAMGDGNHSLATAKACYERLKRNHPEEDLSDHPARYALVELENIHDEAQQFEAIHRILKSVDTKELLDYLKETICSEDGYPLEWYSGKKKGILHIDLRKNQLAVEKLQIALDEYLKENSGEIDYIHGEDVIKQLSAEKNSIGFILPAMKKEELFPGVMAGGVLPRKTFSMGHACEKRYYIEARMIK